MSNIGKDTLSEIPKSPGVYKYFDKEDKLIYIGKAKNLKNRVSSYFQASANHSTKTKRLVKQIVRIEYIIVDSEFDALLLENSLIKENQPKYNIMLRDDKTYPYICVTNEAFPRILLTRVLDRKKGRFFGPYSNVKIAKALLEFIHKNFFVRTCTFNMSENSIKSGKHATCLEFHIKRCLGPCEAKQTKGEYIEHIQEAQQILKGDISSVIQKTKTLMFEHAEKHEFERAHEIKLRLEQLELFQDRSVISNPRLHDLDVFSISSSEKKGFVNYMKVSKGTIIMSKNFELQKSLDETDEDVLAFAIIATRLDINSSAPEVLSNLEINEDLIPNIQVIKPQIGDKKKLIDLSLKNVLLYRKEKTPIEKKLPSKRILETLQNDLQLKNLPQHIECFDNSNIQGTNPVASMVCFKNGTPSKKDYRHYNIKTVIGPDDFASMKEIIGRRYSRLLNERKRMPDLIIVDGGKGQLSSAVEALKEIGLYGAIPIVGIAKRLEEIYYPGDSAPLFISKKSESLKLIQHLRNEAHRFAITFHRDKRSQSFLKTEIDNIPGIGKKTIQKLLEEFKSLKRIQDQDDSVLIKIIGKDKTEKIRSFFKK